MSEGATARSALLPTPLYEEHRRMGARLAPFGGWEMPIDYGSIVEEHHATRQAAGLFDLSHMGEFVVAGHGALDLACMLLTNDPRRLEPGQGQYSPMCRDDGTIVDDVILYHLPEPERGQYLIVVNAANIAKDWAWAMRVRDEEGLAGRTTLEGRSPESALIAIQGPRAEPIVQRLTETPLATLGSFAISRASIGGIAALVARTGYTGEDGFEIFVPNADATPLWRLLLERGHEDGLRPVGLGARDTLRLEARLPLYGSDITDGTSPLEAGLGRFVRIDKPRFRGKEALERLQAAGPEQKLLGLAMDDRSVPRAHYQVLDAQGEYLGEVTSGTFSPTLARGIALAYLPAQVAIGTAVQVVVRGQQHPATVVKTPFYRRGR